MREELQRRSFQLRVFYGHFLRPSHEQAKLLSSEQTSPQSVVRHQPDTYYARLFHQGKEKRFGALPAPGRSHRKIPSEKECTTGNRRIGKGEDALMDEGEVLLENAASFPARPVFPLLPLSISEKLLH